jgi:aspartate/glutamate racemase
VRYQDLTRSELDIIADSIRKFNAGEDKKGQARRVSAVANKYVDIGVETVILGCTEISLMLQGTDIRKIDTMDILSDAALKLAQKA